MRVRLPLCLGLVVILTALCPTARADLAVTNLRGGETLRYPIALLAGTATAGSDVRVRNHSNRRPDGTNATPVVDGRFKVLVELVPGRNLLTLEAGGFRRDLRLTYRPVTSERRLNVVFVTAEDGDTRYMAQREDDPQDYREKLDTACKLMQTLTAEKMRAVGFGRRTFGLEFDSEGKVVVHVARYPAPAAELLKRDGGELYGLLYDWVDRQYPMERYKNLVVMAFTRLDPATKRVGGHTALGGGGMGLFGSGSMCSWPSSIRQVWQAFTDATAVDGDRVLDDSAYRGTMWGLAATTIGAMLHEMGHTVGLPHSPDPESVMSRGFDHFNRVFTLMEPPHKGGSASTRFSERQEAYWDPPFAARLSFHPWFQPDGPRRARGGAPTARLDPATDEVVIEAAAGIGTVVAQPESPKRLYEVWTKRSPKEWRARRSELRARLGALDGAHIGVVDTQGRELWVEESKLTAPR